MFLVPGVKIPIGHSNVSSISGVTMKFISLCFHNSLPCMSITVIRILKKFKSYKDFKYKKRRHFNETRPVFKTANLLTDDLQINSVLPCQSRKGLEQFRQIQNKTICILTQVYYYVYLNVNPLDTDIKTLTIILTLCMSILVQRWLWFSCGST